MPEPRHSSGFGKTEAMLQRKSEPALPARGSRRGAVAWDQRLEIKEGSTQDFPLASGLTLHPLCIIWAKGEALAVHLLKDETVTEGTSSMGHEEGTSRRTEGDRR